MIAYVGATAGVALLLWITIGLPTAVVVSDALRFGALASLAMLIVSYTACFAFIGGVAIFVARRIQRQQVRS